MRDFSENDILEAIKGTGGIISTVAKKLKCDWHTAKKYIYKYESTLQAFEGEQEMILDIADAGLYELVREKDLGAIKWLQSTKGKHRGYVQQQNLDHTTNGESIKQFTVEIIKPGGNEGQNDDSV